MRSYFTRGAALHVHKYIFLFKVTEGSTRTQEITYTFDDGLLTGSNGDDSSSVKVNG